MRRVFMLSEWSYQKPPVDIQKNSDVATEADGKSATWTNGKKLCDKDMLFSASLMENSVSIWNVRTRS